MRRSDRPTSQGLSRRFELSLAQCPGLRVDYLALVVNQYAQMD
jgi:hypothetical protein